MKRHMMTVVGIDRHVHFPPDAQDGRVLRDDLRVSEGHGQRLTAAYNLLSSFISSVSWRAADSKTVHHFQVIPEGALQQVRPGLYSVGVLGSAC